jgi:hypothetical protein
LILFQEHGAANSIDLLLAGYGANTSHPSVTRPLELLLARKDLPEKIEVTLKNIRKEQEHIKYRMQNGSVFSQLADIQHSMARERTTLNCQIPIFSYENNVLRTSILSGFFSTSTQSKPIKHITRKIPSHQLKQPYKPYSDNIHDYKQNYTIPNTNHPH